MRQSYYNQAVFRCVFIDLRWRFILLAAVFCWAFAACGPAIQPVIRTVSATPTASRTVLPTRSPTARPTSTLMPTASSTPTLSPTPSLTPQPSGCLLPPDDYTLVNVNGWLLNQRTMAMLEQAAKTYDGELEITGYAITQGSYHDNGAASFGTHLGGGAVDLSVMRTGTYQVLWDDIDPLIQALRAAGFAAWLRDLDDLYPGSPIHIHAIAIGDRDLSTAAIDQLVGPRGYFRGLNGIPYDEPILDHHGGPILCQWMLDLGYSDLRMAIP